MAVCWGAGHSCPTQIIAGAWWDKPRGGEDAVWKRCSPIPSWLLLLIGWRWPQQRQGFCTFWLCHQAFLETHWEAKGSKDGWQDTESPDVTGAMEALRNHPWSISMMLERQSHSTVSRALWLHVSHHTMLGLVQRGIMANGQMREQRWHREAEGMSGASSWPCPCKPDTDSCLFARCSFRLFWRLQSLTWTCAVCTFSAHPRFPPLTQCPHALS